uniref:Protein spaetzle n=1 Tax=Panagrellus redivivus TaxID=6233 RepID=A0A7E4WCT0_PANRE
MPTWRIHVALVAVLVITLPVQANARPPKENFFSKFFDSVIPWRRSASEAPPTTTPNAEIESILNAIDTTTDENVKISNGRLMLNGTDLFAVDGNGSTVEEVNVVTASKPSTSSSEAPISGNSTRIPPLHRRRNCDKLSLAEKYKRLEKIGAKNPIFMAASLEEGRYGFKPLVSRNESKQEKDIDRLSDAVGMRAFMGVLEEEDVEDDDDYCDDFCQEVTNTIKTIEKGANPARVQPMMYNMQLHDTSAEHLPAEAPKCVLDDFVPYNNECNHNRGTSDGLDGLSKLCSACQGVYRLADNCFPNLINGIQCSSDKDQSDCIFLRSQSNGECKSKTIPLTILRNIGTSECENWIRETIEVPIACECYLLDKATISAVPRP